MSSSKNGHKCFLDPNNESDPDKLCHRDSCYGCSYWQREMWTREDDDDYDGDGM